MHSKDSENTLKTTIVKSIFGVILSGCLGIGTIAGGSAAIIEYNMLHSAHARDLAQTSLTTTSDDDLTVPNSLPTDFYVLLLGVDADENRRTGTEASLYGTSDSSYRSDSIIVAHVNTNEKKIALMSLHRDIKTEINGYENDNYKLNAAYALGGVSLMKKEAEELCGVDIDYYACIDMDGLEKLVDSVGGIEVDVEQSSWYKDKGVAFYDEYLEAGIQKAGIQTLNGHDAMLYARSRHAWVEDDFARARHQRQVLQALAKKVMTNANLMSLQSTATTVSENVSTNMNVSQIFELAAKMMGMNTDTNILSMMTPTTNKMIDGASYEIVNTSEWKELLYNFYNLTNPDTTSNTNTNNNKNK